MTGPLPLHPLGRTGLPVTRVGLGLAALGRPAYHNLGHGTDLRGRQDRDAMRAHCHAMLDAAWSLGLRYVDVARSYGDGEAFLASWLRARGRAPHHPVVGSKWGYTYVGDWRLDAPVHEVKDHGLPTFTDQARQSDGILGRHLAVYSVHSATADAPVLRDDALWDALAAWRDRTGGRLGVTVTGPAQAAAVRHVLAHRADAIDVIHATFNVLDPSAGQALAEAHRAGLGVVVKEGVANGRLTTRAPDSQVGATLRREAVRLHTTPDALALAWILDHPFVDVVLSGATTVAQLRANAAAVDVALDDDARAALGALAMPASTYWSRRKALPWT